MLRDGIVVVHASAGIVGLVTGLAAIPPTRPPRVPRWIRSLYPVCLVVLLTSLVALIIVDWQRLPLASRLAYTGLAALAAVMVWRMLRALREAAARADGWRSRYLAHVYFTYIALWIGFLVLPALDLPYPQVSVPIVVIGALLLGNVLVTRYRRRLLADSGAGVAD